MAMANPYDIYRKVTVETASRGELLLMLYDGAVRFSSQAIQAIQDRDPARAHQWLVRVQDIVSELSVTLDLERGGEIATSLSRLYEYMGYRLTEANVRKDVEPIREVLRMLQELREAWRTAVKSAQNVGACEKVTA